MRRGSAALFILIICVAGCAAPPVRGAISLGDRSPEALVEAGCEEYERQNLDAAIGDFCRVVALAPPGSPEWAKAAFNAGVALRAQGRAREAIAIELRLIESRADDKEAGSNLMEVYRNYHHRAALEISAAYEERGEPEDALKWAKRARDDFPYRSWCGTCINLANERLEKRIEYLQKMARK